MVFVLEIWWHGPIYMLLFTKENQTKDWYLLHPIKTCSWPFVFHKSRGQGWVFDSSTIFYLTPPGIWLASLVSSHGWKIHTPALTHWGRDRMADIWQTTLSNTFSCMKILELWLIVQWNLFPMVQLAKSHHWLRLWLSTNRQQAIIWMNDEPIQLSIHSFIHSFIKAYCSLN